jgi:hypothetical protein
MDMIALGSVVRGRGRLAGRRYASCAVACALGGLLAAVCAGDAGAYRRVPKSEPDSAHRTRPAAPKRYDGPLQIVVSIGAQRLTLYSKGQAVEQSTISTGVDGYPTPTGLFSVIDKEPVHHSNIYGGAAMPFMQRLTMSGVALHSGQVTGRPASHGCIRLPHAFAQRLFNLTALGTRVVVASGEPALVEVSHPRFLLPKARQVASLGRERTLDAADEGHAASRPATAADAALHAASDLQKSIVRARMGTATAERVEALDALAISIFVSRAEGRVFVRQAFEPLFDAPIIIREEDRPLGTHLFLAIEPKEALPQLRWTAVSLSAGASNPDKAATAAADALERIELAHDVADRIAALLAPGAALIVSDQARSREMRPAGTDFIVLGP